MNKGELSQTLAEKTGFSKKDAERFIDAFTGTVVDTLKQGENVNIVGFGKFEAKQKASRQGRNPKTGEPMTIPAKVAAKFSAGKAFKEALN